MAAVSRTQDKTSQKRHDAGNPSIQKIIHSIVKVPVVLNGREPRKQLLKRYSSRRERASRERD
eukprot:scaffold41966_cov35-Attheya_sp.AAC.1